MIKVDNRLQHRLNVIEKFLELLKIQKFKANDSNITEESITAKKKNDKLLSKNSKNKGSSKSFLV